MNVEVGWVSLSARSWALGSVLMCIHVQIHKEEAERSEEGAELDDA